MALPTANTTNDSSSIGGLLIKSWTFSGTGFWLEQGAVDGYNYSSAITLDPATGSVLVPQDVIDSLGTAGQGNSNPPGRFANHFLVRWDYVDEQVVTHSWYLDPSYGLAKSESLNDWENAALDGTYVSYLPNGTILNIAGKNYFLSRTKKNDLTTLEVKEIELP